MHRTSRIKITDLNPHLVCILCGGYYVDATTIVECLHSFCRTCIVRYLDGSKYCPICDVQVHKTRPLLHIRRDKTLQALVYKLVPNLFKNEMERRRQFYAEHPEAGPSSSRASGEERGVIIPGLSPDKKALVDEEHISLSLEYSDNGKPVDEIDPSTLEPDNKLPEKRYLLCPSGFTVGHLKKFIKTKFELSSTHLVQVFHTDEPLVDHYTLMDVAYIYTWRRKGPLRLYFTIYLKKESSRTEGKKRKISESSDKTEENDSASECKRTASSTPPSLRVNGTMNGTNGNAVDDGNNTTSSSEEIVSKPMTATISSVTSSVNVSKTTATPSAMTTTITLSSKPVKSETPPWLVAAMANAQRQAQTNAQTRVENMRKPPQEVSSANRTKTSQRTDKLTKSPPKSTLEKALLAPSSKVFVSQHLQNNVCKSSQVSRAPTSVHKTPTPVLSRVLAPAGNRPGGRVLPPGGVMPHRLMAPRFDVPQRSLTSSPEPVNTTSFLSKIATTPRAQTHNPVSPLDKITQTLQMAKMKSLNSNKISASKPMTSTGTTKPMPSTGSTKPMPSTGTTKPMPSTGTNKQLPGPGTTKPVPTTGSTKPMPSTGATKPMPSTGATKLIPSTGSTKPISSVGTTTTVYSSLKSGAINSRAGPSKSQDAGCQMKSTKPVSLTVLTQPRSQPKSATLAKTIQKLTASQQPPPGKFQSTMAAMNNTLVSLPIPTSPLKTSAMTPITSSITSPALIRPPPVSPLLNSSHSSILSVPRSLPATNAAMAALKPTGANIFKIMSQMSTSKSVMTPKPSSTSISTVTSKPGVTLTSVTNVKPASKPIMTSSVIATSSSQISKTTVALAKSTSLSIVTPSGGSIKTTPSQQVGSSTPSAKVAVTSSVAQKCSSPKLSNVIPVSNLPPPPSPILIPSPSASPPVPAKTPPTPPKTKSPIAAPPSPVYSDPPQEKSLDLSKKRTKSDTNSNSEICLNGDHVNGETSTNGDSCKRLKTEETR